MMPDDALRTAALRTVADCMAVKAGEELTVVTDTATRDVGEALAAAASQVGAEVIWASMKPRGINGEEPPAAIAALMLASTVLLLATRVSLSHTRARKAACEAGARAASMPGVTPDMMARTMNVDYRAVAAHSRRLAEALRDVTTLHLTSRKGTDLALNLQGREFGADVGIYDRPGAFGNLPAGEVCAGPTAAGSSGVAVFDGSFAGVGLLREPIRIVFENGVAASVEGGAEAEKLKQLIAPFGEGGRLLAEIGIGTHPSARLTGAVLEDEKIRGTVHLALGNNLGFGGDNDVGLHVDGVILEPTLATDVGQVIIDAGVLKMD
jgi:leucyl aminopeptidase (aminopeptidase T)